VQTKQNQQCKANEHYISITNLHVSLTCTWQLCTTKPTSHA